MSSVDIVVPCYNYGRFLGECVDSILSQEGVDFRVLIIDDFSSDESATVGKELAAADERVSFLRHEANAGHIATYNEGIEWARAEFWMLISADDLVAPGALARAARIADSDPGVGLVYGRDLAFSSSEELAGIRALEIGNEDYQVISGREFLNRSCEAGSNLVATPTAFVRLDLLRQIGGYRSELPQTADMELQLQIAARSAVGITESVQAYKRMHATSMGRQYYAAELDDLEGRKSAFDQFFRSSEKLLGEESAALREQADRSLARNAFWSASRAFDLGDGRACRDLHAFFASLDPEAVSRGARIRFGLKGFLGAEIWSRIYPVVGRFRS